MEAIRVKAKALFNYAEDGIHAVALVPGQVVHARAHLVPGLLAEGLVEETTEELTTPEQVLELHAAHADPHVEAGVTPWQGARAGEQEPTVVEDEHLEPVRRRAKERAASGKGVAAVAQPGNPPPVDDRKTPPHPPGSVIDADDRAARDAAVDAARQGIPARGHLAPEATEAARVTGKTLDEVLAGPGGKATASDKAKALADERGEPADIKDDKAKAGGGYATKDERVDGRKRDRLV